MISGADVISLHKIHNVTDIVSVLFTAVTFIFAFVELFVLNQFKNNVFNITRKTKNRQIQSLSMFIFCYQVTLFKMIKNNHNRRHKSISI